MHYAVSIFIMVRMHLKPVPLSSREPPTTRAKHMVVARACVSTYVFASVSTNALTQASVSVCLQLGKPCLVRAEHGSDYISIVLVGHELTTLCLISAQHALAKHGASFASE